jgi:hypothetical protein
VIHNAVLHIANEQPLVVDLYDMPTATDVSLLCTNVRMLGGKKPVFVDHSESVFVFPYDTIRFVEIPAPVADAMPADGGDGVAIAAGATAATPDDPDDGDLELDEDFLRRIREV